MQPLVGGEKEGVCRHDEDWEIGGCRYNGCWEKGGKRGKGIIVTERRGLKVL